MLVKYKKHIKKWYLIRKLLSFYKKNIIILNFLIDGIIYIKHSNTFNFDSNVDGKIATIILSYHIIEKGLTMPKMRLGFGKDRVLYLCEKCDKFIDLHGTKNKQLVHALGVLNEYTEVHKDAGYKLDEKIEKSVQLLSGRINQIPKCQPKLITAKDVEMFPHMDFLNFAYSRSTLRNYTSEVVREETLRKVINLSQNVPSACNRQPNRIHSFNDRNKIKQILSFQNGNRGFGELAHNLIIVATDLHGYKTKNERTMNFIDGGIYLMNLVYALQYYKLGSCILNWGVDHKTDKKMRAVADIPNNEIIIAIVLFGYYPDNVTVPSSLKKKVDEVCTFHKLGGL